jgi:FAD/FMN-containing dehydrogenase
VQGPRSVQRFLTRRSVGSAYRAAEGRSDHVLAFSDLAAAARTPGLIQDMEVAVPYEQAVPAVRVLRDHFRSTGAYPLLPVHIRCSARSDLWLSPAYGRAVCWLEVWQYPASAGLFERVHNLMAPFGYRAHWGKETRAAAAYLSRQYPRWPDFVRLRAEWDPDGVFLNPYLASIFASGPAPTEGGDDPATPTLAHPGRLS